MECRAASRLGQRWPPLLVLLALLVLFFLYPRPARKVAALPPERSCEQWVVVTTIHPPSATIKRLASFPKWCVVVVGDTKSPRTWFWPNVTYLSVEAQQHLGYQIAEILPTSHYSRKNIGYLYAIEHGARAIYETDDDNFPLSEPGAPPGDEPVRVRAADSVINPYVHFGQRSVWPRGYPLERIADPPANTLEEVTGTLEHVGIFQGLANGDPDVDAVFRLTRKNRAETLNLAFDRARSIALPRGIYAPFNSQNTLFSYEAFWGLLIPVSTTFRVCDIWRGYWVQRLLWDLDLQLAFTRPTVYQRRNSHDYFADYIDERDLYEKAGAFVRMLSSWRSVSKSFETRMEDTGGGMGYFYIRS